MVRGLDLKDFKSYSGNIYIHKDADISSDVEIKFGTIIYENVSIEEGSKIFENVIIRPEVSIGKNCEIHNSVEIGYNYQSGLRTIIGDDSIIRKGSIIYANNFIGKSFQTGNYALIRENCNFDEFCSVGSLAQFDGYANVGKFSRFSYGVHVGRRSNIGNNVWVFPYTVFTTDKYPPYDVCPPSTKSKGALVENFAIIATECVIMPGIKIGKDSMIGVGSVVTKDVPEGELWFGVPAKFVKKMENIIWESDFAKKFGIDKPYPWRKSLRRDGYLIIDEKLDET